MWEDDNVRSPRTQLKHVYEQLFRVMNDGSGHCTALHTLDEQCVCVCVWECTVTYTESMWGEESWISQVRAATALQGEWAEPLKLSTSVISGFENPRVLINFNEPPWRISWKPSLQMKRTWQQRTTRRQERLFILHLVLPSTQKSIIVWFYFFSKFRSRQL